MYKALLISTLLTLPLLCQAQGPRLQSTYPVRHSITSSRQGPITLNFSGSVANPAAIRINGNQICGQSTGGLSGAGTSQITFRPAQPFAPGERVSITVPTSVSSPAQVVEFRAAAARGQARFSLPNVVGSVSDTQPLAAVAGDLDNDGDIDLLIAESEAGRVCLNNSVGLFTAQAIPIDISRHAYELRLEDFNGDGNLDILSSGQFAETSLSLGTGKGTFLPRILVANSRLFPHQLATGDFNADGLMDAVLSEMVGTGAELRVLWGSKDGSFDVSPAQAVSLPARDIGAADMDEDGDIDLLLLSDRVLGVYLNDGNGHFTAGATTDVYSVSGALTLGDFTGDGHTDVVCTSNDVSVMSLVAGTGTGGLQPKRPIATLTRTSQLGSGDMDGDGDLDLLVTTNRGTTQVLLNQGNGEFEFTTTSATLMGYEAFIMADAADLNGDGLLDIYTAHGVSNPRMPHGIDIFFNQPITVTQTLGPVANAPFTVFPNPAHGRLTATLPAAEHSTTIELRDITGRLLQRPIILAGSATRRQVPIDLSRLPAGLYIIQAKTADWQAIQRVVVE